MRESIATLLVFFIVSTALSQDISSKADLWNPGTTQLRGANIWQKALFKEGQPFEFDRMETRYTGSNLAKFRRWNANFANLSHQGTLHTHQGPGGKYPLVREIRYHLRQLVWDFRDNQMFVVVSFRTGPGRTEKVFSSGDSSELLAYLFELDPKTGLPTAKATQAQDAWVDMWRDTASLLKNEPNVIGYHLMVEPLTDAERDITPPAAARAKGVRLRPAANDDPLMPKRLAAWHDFALRMAAAIRDVDKSTPILVGGAPYNAAATLATLPVKKFDQFQPVIFCVSQYEPYQFSEQGQGTYAEPERQRLHAAYNAMAKFAGSKNPNRVAVTEFGCFRWAGTPKKPLAPVYLAEQLQLLEKYGLNHALWLWEVDDLDYNSPLNFRLGVDMANAKCDAADSDPLVKTIADNWSLNRLFATPEILDKLRR
jgi:hypothetical protein